MDLEQRRHEALMLNDRYPGVGKCGRCRRTWQICEPHATPYTFQYKDQLPLHTCFSLCEECWQELTIEERLPYYHELFRSWQREGEGEETWLLMEKAVRRGL